MDIKLIKKFRHHLRTRRDLLFQWLNSPSAGTRRIIGQVEKAATEMSMPHHSLVTEKIDSALEQIARGEFGHCTLCDGEVEEERLALDFTTSVCLDHYSEKQKRELEQDLELAAKVQKQLFPDKIPSLPGLQIAVRSEPSKIVGGDYFDFFPLGGNRQGIIIADVMGKGLPASMLMSNLQASLRILAPENENLENTVTRLNKLFRYNLKTIKFITLFIAAIDVQQKSLIYCNAGHNPPLWFQHESSEIKLLNPTGPALGILSEGEFITMTVKFHPGDVFLFYTDGLVEAQQSKEEFGEERLKIFLRQNKDQTAQQIVSQLFQTVKNFANKERDDSTALLIKVDNP